LGFFFLQKPFVLKILIKIVDLALKEGKCMLIDRKAVCHAGVWR